MIVLDSPPSLGQENQTEGSPSQDRPAFVYRHVVSFEETNVVGNVYFARHVAWQGRCREMFLRTHAPGVLDEIRQDLRLVTLRVSCDYFAELQAFNEVELRMRLAFVRQHRIGLDFDYWAVTGGTDQLTARGFQEIGCMRKRANGLIAVAVPEDLASTLKQFEASSP